MSAHDSPPPPILELSGVAIASLPAPDLIVLEDVNWSVRPGEYWVIGGPPGSGKSDLLATASGLLRPARGVHRLFGKDITHLSEEERIEVQLRVGMVFGGGGRLFAHLTVAENLALPLCYHQNCTPGASQERVRTVLAAMGLTEVQHNTPAAIDRTMQHRTALARALMLAPDILFMDNPLAGTGPRELRWWLEFLDELRLGHPLLNGRHPALVVGTSNLEHWGNHGDEFALVQGRRFQALGGRANLARQSDPALRELLPLDWLSE